MKLINMIPSWYIYIHAVYDYYLKDMGKTNENTVFKDFFFYVSDNFSGSRENLKINFLNFCERFPAPFVMYKVFVLLWHDFVHSCLFCFIVFLVLWFSAAVGVMLFIFSTHVLHVSGFGVLFNFDIFCVYLCFKLFWCRCVCFEWLKFIFIFSCNLHFLKYIIF